MWSAPVLLVVIVRPRLVCTPNSFGRFGCRFVVDHRGELRKQMGAGAMKLMSTNGVAGVLRELLPGFEQSTGTKVELVLDSSNGLLGRIAAGETADAAILTVEAIDDLT